MWLAMLRAIIMFCLFSCANLEMQRFQHQVYISRKSRSNQDPVTTGFIYNKAGEGPGRITTFDDTYMKPSEKHVEIKIKDDANKNNKSAKETTMQSQENWRTKNTNKELYSAPKQNDENTKAKTKCPALNGREAPENMIIKPTIGIHSKQSFNTMKEMLSPYAADKEFIIDNEDVRTDSRNTYNGWPYSYNGPYGYEMKNVTSDAEKAKDKRFLGVYTTIKPVRKNVMENIPSESNAASSKDPIIDNPIYGDQPFFSFVLNDYFDKHHEEEPLIFKDFSWAEEFDNELSSRDIDDNERRSRRLHHNYNPSEIQKMDMSQMHTKTADKESVTEKNHGSSQEHKNYRKGNDKKDHQKLNHNYIGQRETAFKDFADSFANKFGSEKNNKNSKFMLKTNQDKGQKRKGFKRVYHKDEYVEDNEFYDNIDKNAQSEESGGSTISNGGSQAFLQSQAVGSTGDEANLLAKSGNKIDKMFENHYQAKKGNKKLDSKINHYRNMAKDAALSNNADYIDNFRL